MPEATTADALRQQWQGLFEVFQSPPSDPTLFRQRIRFVEQARGNLQDALARLGHLRVALAVTHKQLHTQFFFKLADLLGERGLRGMQHLGGSGQIQAASNRLT